ncbi:hypothetical protein RND71_036591 [Anisodus tanguticus]|uniref:Nuclear pore complex protein Nup205 n=1 Tax=Anisodus tanguticus TaxID=243964 RepID=A0AAE1R402_9SOLA|nr:hypothetical protein RND71_036591 [Anisodus tanguticus]
MVLAKILLSLIESTVLGPTPPTPSQRIELLHAIRHSLPSFQSLLSYPPPKPSDRVQVQSKEVRLPDSGPISLDDQDVQIALKLSDDLHLNEVDSVQLLVSANQEWGLLGREPLEIFRLAAGLWYTERRDLITSLYTLLRAVVLDQGLEPDLVADIQRFLDDLINAGVRKRLISLIKELNREEPAALGGPNCERYVLDSRGALVERRAVVSRERLILAHCLVLSVLVVRASPKDVKDVFSALKDSAAGLNGSTDTLSHQITYSLLFSLVVALISDALSAVPYKTSVLSRDASFRHEFQESVMIAGNDPVVEGYVDCLRMVFSNNVFLSWLNKILLTPTYQNDDEDMIYMYNAYLHKMITCLLSHPLAKDKVKEEKEKAMTALSPYRLSTSHEYPVDGIGHFQKATEPAPQAFVSLLEFVSEIYQKEPELLSGNDVLWTFVNFAGEDHTNFQTLVAFLRMLSTLASSAEGASKVFELLQGKTFRSIGWSTLFDCLSIYEEQFKQALQSPGAVLPEIQEGDAKALVAYLNVLQKVVENANPVEKKNWFPDTEPLFKLLGYENVPPYLKGALRNAIATFVQVSPVLKDTTWRYLEQYDLPVVAGSTTQSLTTQVYDMRFELNEIEARREQYLSTISFINLLNTLIAAEKDVSDRGHRMLSMYSIRDEDIDSVVAQSQLSEAGQSAPLQMQLPDFMSGKTVFRNIMSILSPGVNYLISERTSQIYGQLVEKAVLLSLEIVNLVLEKDLAVSEFWRPLYQPLDVILSQDQNQVVALLEYVRYDLQPRIQQSSIKIMNILSSRMVGLVQLLLKSNASGCLVEDYAACLELRSEECQIIEDCREDSGVLILQLLIDNISRPAPSITHLLLKFDVDGAVERTVLQPKFHYSCLKIILDVLEKLLKPDVNALLHEFAFQLIIGYYVQLLYELCTDPLTCNPMMDFLSTKKYWFFVQHLDVIGIAPLPKRNSSQALRISSLHQRAWLLKLLTIELHAADMSSSTHREACQSILSQLFGEGIFEHDVDLGVFSPYRQISPGVIGARMISKTKVLELLEVFQFKSPDTVLKSSQAVSSAKYGFLAEDILTNAATSENGGVYYYSERGDRLIDLAAFHDNLWQKYNLLNPQHSSFNTEVELNEIRDTIQQLLRWGWKYNKNLEEQAAQLHMLTGWSQIVEVSASRKLSSLPNRSEILFQLLDSSLSASGSPDCSLKMALILTQVGVTCMAKLRDEGFLSPSGLNSDTVTCLDIMMTKQLSNGACHSILFKLILAILRNESSEALRRRQYALLLSYIQYCQHMFDPDLPTTVMQLLTMDEQENDDLDLEKIIKDATHGSESGKTILLYVLDALICIDHEKFFLSQMQSRGFLRSCLVNINNFSQDGGRSLESMQRVCTLEAELALLLRISHKYGKSGAQVLFSMGAFEHISACKALNMQLKGSYRRMDGKFGRELSVDVDKQRMIIAPILRLVFSLTSLVDASEFFEVKNKIVREVIEFVRSHQLLFDQILREDLSDADNLTMEQINLVVGILTKERRKAEVNASRLCFSLSSYLCFLVTKKSLRLTVSDGPMDYRTSTGQQQPTLNLLGFLLNSLTTALERATEDIYLLLSKIQDVNELSRQEVDEIINMFVPKGCISSSENIQKRRYFAMLEMCQIVGDRNQLMTLLLLLAENVMNIILVHFQDGSFECGTKPYSKDDLNLLCGKLISALERLELLSEDKTGHDLKVFRRLASSLKEISIQKSPA